MAVDRKMKKRKMENQKSEKDAPGHQDRNCLVGGDAVLLLQGYAWRREKITYQVTLPQQCLSQIFM